MNKIFTTLALGAALLVPALANAADSVQSITPAPGGLYEGGTIEISVGKNVSASNATAYPYVYFEYTGKSKYEPSWQQTVAKFESASGDAYTYVPNKDQFYIKADVEVMKEAGATEFTIYIEGWKNSNAYVTCNVAGTSYSNGVITFKYKLVDDGTTDPGTGGQDPDPDPDPTPGVVTGVEIDWNTVITPGSLGDFSYKFTGKGTAAEIVTNNPQNDLTIGNPDFLLKNGTEPVNGIQTITTDAGNTYITPALEEGVTYQLNFYCPKKDFNFEIKEVSDDTPVKEPQEVFAGGELTWDADQTYFYKATEDGKLKLTISYAAEGDLSNEIVFTNQECTSPLNGVSVGSQNGYNSYEFNVVNGETYYFYFTSPSYIMATLTYSTDSSEENPNPSNPTYMSALPYMHYDAQAGMETLFFYWNESLYQIDEDVKLSATLTTPQGSEINVPVYISTFYPEAENEPGYGDASATNAPDNALLIPLASVIALNGAGQYDINIASIVMNAAGEWNSPIEESFTATVSEYAEGIVTPQSGAIFAVGENVEFTIAYKGEVVVNENADAVIMVYADSMESQYTWSDSSVVSVEGEEVVIKLGNTLAEGYYQLTLYEDVLTVDGNANASLEINFQVGSETEGIEGLELNEGVKAIYNLQGQKVNQLGKGLYIINGKKVMVK